jgi:hypothetical protein
MGRQDPQLEDCWARRDRFRPDDRAGAIIESTVLVNAGTGPLLWGGAVAALNRRRAWFEMRLGDAEAHGIPPA